MLSLVHIGFVQINVFFVVSTLELVSMAKSNNLDKSKDLDASFTNIFV